MAVLRGRFSVFLRFDAVPCKVLNTDRQRSSPVSRSHRAGPSSEVSIGSESGVSAAGRVVYNRAVSRTIAASITFDCATRGAACSEIYVHTTASTANHCRSEAPAGAAVLDSIRRMW